MHKLSLGCPISVRSRNQLLCSDAANSTLLTSLHCPHAIMATPLPPPHHRSSSTSSIVAQTAQSLFLRLSNASTLQFDSSPASRTSISSHTPTPSPNSRRSSESLPPTRDPNYTFYTDPRFARWNSEREQLRTASKNFLAFDPAYTRRNYISELRAATAEEYGADLLHHATGYPSPSAVPGTATTEQEDNSVYTHILSLREQIAAAEEASEMQRRRELHRNFSVFIPAPTTPRKMSAAETEVGSRRSRYPPPILWCMRC